MPEPLLYLSRYFKTHRESYYELLQKVRMEGNWEGWLRFFLTGVRETSEQAVQTARRLIDLFDQDRPKIKALGRDAKSALRIHHELQKKPVSSIPQLVKLTGLSTPTVAAQLRNLARIGIVKEIRVTGRKRAFVYSRYLEILGEGRGPLT